MRKSKNVRRSYFLWSSSYFIGKTVLKKKAKETMAFKGPVNYSFLWKINCALLIYLLLEITHTDFFPLREQDHNLKMKNRISYDLGFFVLVCWVLGFF